MTLVAVIAALAHSTPARGYPGWWRRAAHCIRVHESGERWQLRNRPYGGAYEFNDGTWAAFRPRGFPARSWEASPAQQTLVAWRVWVANGRRFGGGQWPVTSRLCGVP